MGLPFKVLFLFCNQSTIEHRHCERVDKWVAVHECLCACGERGGMNFHIWAIVEWWWRVPHFIKSYMHRKCEWRFSIENVLVVAVATNKSPVNIGLCSGIFRGPYSCRWWWCCLEKNDFILLKKFREARQRWNAAKCDTKSTTLFWCAYEYFSMGKKSYSIVFVWANEVLKTSENRSCVCVCVRASAILVNTQCQMVYKHYENAIFAINVTMGLGNSILHGFLFHSGCVLLVFYNRR